LQSNAYRYGGNENPTGEWIYRFDMLSIHFASSGETLAEHIARVLSFNLQ